MAICTHLFRNALLEVILPRILRSVEHLKAQNLVIIQSVAEGCLIVLRIYRRFLHGCGTIAIAFIKAA